MNRVIIEKVIFRSWWLFFFLLIGLLGYGESIKKKNGEIKEIKNRISQLEKEKEAVLDEREDLVLRINSQSDPAWMERVLIKELGVVPEGKVKVHFAARD